MKITSIIIPCYNQLKYTKLCLESVMKYTAVPYELILIDNGSFDGTFEYFKTLKAQNFRGEREKLRLYSVRLIRNTKNLGYTEVCNQGIKIAKGDYILLLNNDTIVTKGWLRRMIVCAERDPRIGIVGPQTNDYPIILENEKELAYSHQVLSQIHRCYPVFASANKNKDCFKVPVVYGSSMLIKREVIEKVGFLDEQFGMGGLEDDDYCIRAKREGYKVIRCNNVFVFHFGGRTFFNIKVNGNERMKKNYEIFIWKWGKKGIEHINSVYSLERAIRWYDAEKRIQENFSNFSLSSFIKQDNP